MYDSYGYMFTDQVKRESNYLKVEAFIIDDGHGFYRDAQLRNVYRLYKLITHEQQTTVRRYTVNAKS